MEVSTLKVEVRDYYTDRKDSVRREKEEGEGDSRGRERMGPESDGGISSGQLE